jgi:nitrous oxide reductase
MKKETRSKLGRRNFLIAAGIGGAATVAAIAGQAVGPAKPETAASNDKRSGKGYQDSAHIRSYYNTTKV